MYRKRKGKRAADATESIAETAANAAPAISSGDWKKLPVIGPLDYPSISIGKYAYRDNPLVYNQDRVEVIQSHKQLNLGGVHYDNSAVKVASSSLAYIEDNFWSDVYLMLHEMAQYKDGYKSIDASLTTALVARYRDEIIITAKINIRVLWALYHCTLYNEGMKTMMSAFGGKRRRMMEILDRSNQVVYPVEWDALINYWSTVFTPYPGGPVCYNLFAPKALVTDPATGTLTAWANNDRPDLTLTADITSLLDDIELLLSIVDRYNISTAATKVDFKLMASLYKMMAFPTPQTGVRGLTVSLQLFIEQFKQGLFHFADNKGVGTDTTVCAPLQDIGGDINFLVRCNDYGAPYDEAYLMGMKSPYAIDFQDSATPGYAASTEKMAVFGLVRNAELAAADGFEASHTERLYTPEDGWYEPVFVLDATAAAGLQAYFWSLPHITLHPRAWSWIASEEPYENYRSEIDIIGRGSFNVPFDHFGENYRDFLFKAYKIP